MSLLSRIADERFFEYRRRSTSIAGIIVAVMAVVLFEYRYFVQHRWSWDLFSIGIGFVVIKLTLMGWYYLKS
jgi:hypothetical protein